MASTTVKQRWRKKRCPWCGNAIRKASRSEEENLRKIGTPAGYTMTVHQYERCTTCKWAHIRSTVQAAA